MNFKDLVRNDIENIFMNADEFAETHNIDGKDMVVMVDNNEMLEREKRYKALEDGIFRKQVLFYVSAVKFGRLPAIGKIMVFDKKQYKVTDAIREGGVYSISLEAAKQ